MTSNTPQNLDLRSVPPEIASPLRRLSTAMTVDDTESAFTDLKHITRKGDNPVVIATAVLLIPVIVAAMERHGESASVQKAACVALNDLALNDLVANVDIRKMIAAAGGIHAIYAAIARHKGSATVHAAACSAFFHLSNDNRVAIRAIIATMEQNAESSKVQLEACELVVELSYNNRKAIVSAGGIGAVVAAIKLHPECEVLLSTACDALRLLSAGDDEAIIAAAGAVPFIVPAMKRHPESEELQRDACAVFVVLSENKEKSVAIVKAGGIPAIIAAMERHADSDVVQQYACWVLGNLGCSKNDNKVAIARAGGIRAIVAAMERHADLAVVQEEACTALRILSALSSSLRLMQSEGAQLLLEAAKTRFPSQCDPDASIVLYLLECLVPSIAAAA